MIGLARTRKDVKIAVTGALVATSLAMTVLLFVAGQASASSKVYAVLNGTVNAATDHEIAASTAFPNFTTGAVDNYYSMAHSYVDNSPFSEGTSSPAATGPIGQTAAAGHFAQPQYSDARYPGKAKASFGHQGGPYAIASAALYKATSEAWEASGGGSSKIAVPAAFARRLRSALAVWKSRWLSRLHLKLNLRATPLRSRTPAPQTVGLTVPTVTVPTSTTPVVTTPPVTTPTITTPLSKRHKKTHKPRLKTKPLPVPLPRSKSGKTAKPSSASEGSALHSTTLAALENGSLVTSGESSLGSLTLGGQIVIKGIDVKLSITNGGVPKAQVDVAVGSASIGGVPVTIDQSGVHVVGHGTGLPYAKADAALNSGLKKAGVQLFTEAPEVQKSPNEDTITATGVHVLFTQPADAPGVPSQSLEHIFGEVFADSLAVPGVPIGSLGLGGGGGTTSGGSSAGGSSTGGTTSGGTSPGSSSTGHSTGGTPGHVTSYTTTTPGTPGTPGTPATSGSQPQTTTPASFFSLRGKPLWLLLAFFAWQALVLGTAASLWHWRLGGQTA